MKYVNISCGKNVVGLDVNVYWPNGSPMSDFVNGRKGTRCPTQVQRWAFKMKVTPVVRSYLEFKGQKVKAKAGSLCHNHNASKG
jgi:hypothetical protein